VWKQTFIRKSMVDRAETFPFLIVGNKLDLDGEARIVSLTELAAFCDTNGNMSFIETSAKTSTNVEKAFA